MKKLLNSISGMTTEKRFGVLLDLLMRMNIPYEIQNNSEADNIILFPDNLQKDHITFMAHYDIWPGSCGANDNGSSVVILLKLAEYLSSREDTGIVIAFIDREESGGNGCNLYFSLDTDTRLVINLDVCGSGDRIVISDETALDNPYAAFFRKGMTKDIFESDMFPYCDGRRAERMGFDVWSISVFPETDACRMKLIRMTPDDKLLFRKHKNEALEKMHEYMYPMDLDILKYMHRGKYDSIDHINFQIMERVYSYVKECTDTLLAARPFSNSTIHHRSEGRLNMERKKSNTGINNDQTKKAGVQSEPVKNYSDENEYIDLEEFDDVEDFEEFEDIAYGFEPAKSGEIPFSGPYSSKTDYSKETTGREILINPLSIFTYLKERVYKQDEYCKTAAMILYNHLTGHTSANLVCGPAGCGKTHVWECLKEIYPKILIINSATITKEGWKGGHKVTSFLEQVDVDDPNCIVVFDEFDKCATPQHSSNGDNVSASVQSEFLKLVEGERYTVLVSDNTTAKIDTSVMSFVFCGSFAAKAEEISLEKSSSGFGFGKKREEVKSFASELTMKDVISFGVIPELASRIKRIANVRPLDMADYRYLLKNHPASPVKMMEKQYDMKLRLSKKQCDDIAQKAYESGLGIRNAYSQLQKIVDDRIFRNFTKKESDPSF